MKELLLKYDAQHTVRGPNVARVAFNLAPEALGCLACLFDKNTL